MAHTFKVGDIVRGIGYRYGVTNKYMTHGVVVSVGQYDIDVKILEHANEWVIGETYPNLDPTHFELVEPARPAAHKKRTGLYPAKVLYNPPATIEFWSDGTKTVAKCGGGDTFDREKGLAICCAKKLLSKYEYREAFKEIAPVGNRVL